MGMWTTENQDTLSTVLKEFSEAAFKNFKSHSFESGYLQSLAVQMLPHMPKKMQKVFIEDMKRAAIKWNEVAKNAHNQSEGM